MTPKSANGIFGRPLWADQQNPPLLLYPYQRQINRIRMFRPADFIRYEEEQSQANSDTIVGFLIIRISVERFDQKKAHAGGLCGFFPGRMVGQLSEASHHLERDGGEKLSNPIIDIFY